jgi:hypothetical protein
MSYARYATPLRLELRRSRRLLAALVALYGGSLAIPWLLPLSWPWCLSCSMLVAAAGLRAAAVHGWGGRSVAALCWEAGERWRLTLRDGSVRDCRLLPGGYVHPRFAVLRFVPGEAADGVPSPGVPRRWAVSLRRAPVRVVMLAEDSVDAGSFRRLRVRLRLEGPGVGRAAFSGPRAG